MVCTPWRAQDRATSVTELDSSTRGVTALAVPPAASALLPAASGIARGTMQSAPAQGWLTAAAGSSRGSRWALPARIELQRRRAIQQLSACAPLPRRRSAAAAAAAQQPVVAVATPAHSPLSLEAPADVGRRWGAATLLLGAAAAAAGAVAVAGTMPALAAGTLQQIDPHVLGATVGASFKLSLVCCLVGWLLRTKQIPANAAPVLSKVRSGCGCWVLQWVGCWGGCCSWVPAVALTALLGHPFLLPNATTCLQVSFCLLIPCMLFSRCSQILSSAPDPRILLTISCFVVLQVAIGAALGAAVAPAVDRLSRGWQFGDGTAEADGAAGQPSGALMLRAGGQAHGSSAHHVDHQHLHAIYLPLSICFPTCHLCRPAPAGHPGLQLWLQLHPAGERLPTCSSMHDRRQAEAASCCMRV